MSLNNWNYKTAVTVLTGLLIVLSVKGSALGQGGTTALTTAPGLLPKTTTAPRENLPPGRTNFSRAGDTQTPTSSYDYLFSFRHDDIVTCAAFSNDGRWLATGSELGTVLITDIQSRKEIAIKNSDSRDNGVGALRFSQDGQLLVVGGAGNKNGGGEIRILRTSDYTTAMSFDVPGDKAIWYVDLSLDSKWLISADIGDVWVWNLEDKRVAWHLGFEDSAVQFDGDHALLFVGQSASLGLAPGQIAFLNLNDGKVIRVLRTAIKEPVKRLITAKSKSELFALTDGPNVYRLNNQTGEIKQRISFTDLNLRVRPHGLHVWYNTDFEVLGAYPMFVFSDRENTIFMNYVSNKVVTLDHRNSVGIKFNASGKNFALLGGVTDGSLSGVPPQHYWTVSVFSFRPF